MNHGLRFTAEKIAKRLDLIKPNTRIARHPIPEFRLELLPDASAEPGSGKRKGKVAWDSYWAGQDTHFVLRSRFEVPRTYQRPALFLPLGVAGDIFSHPEALLHIDGRPVASADRYHQTVPIDPGLQDDRSHEVMLHGWTGLTGWPPDRTDTSRIQIRRCYVVDVDEALQDFVALAEVALDLARHEGTNARLRTRLLQALDDAFLVLDTRAPLREAFRASIPAAHAALRAGLDEAGPSLPETLHAIGHAHMDIAYLWPIAQIRRKNARTYSNVLRLMDRHPDFRFSHSQPQLYAYTEQDHPDLFAEIGARVAEGRWEVMGGMWVEPDCNIPGGEALVRQIVLGRRWFEERFGDVETPVLWLPDTFGFPWSLPQLMKQAGLTAFITNKLNWNQYNRMPSSTTWWQGIDGTRVLAHCLSTPRQVQHLPFPTNYKSDLSAAEVIGTVSHATGAEIHDLPIAFGYGDGGGGPNDALVRKARAWAGMPGAPRVRMGTVRDFLDALEGQKARLPVWNGELYLEGHRGTYTSQGWIKRANRKTEVLLHDLEAVLAMAHPGGVSAATRDTLRMLWETLCLNQFHDILTGTSVAEVFDDARRDFDAIAATAGALLSDTLEGLTVGQGEWSVLNTAPVPGAGVVFVPEPGHGQDVEGGSLVPVARPAPYTLAPLTPADPACRVTATETGDGITLENGLVSLTVARDGTLIRLHDKRTARDVLPEGETGNQLWASEDRPISWDAWDIDVFHADRAERLPAAAAVTLIEAGPLRAAIRVETPFMASRIVQTIRLTAGSARIDFVTDVEWHEHQMLLRVAFPTGVLSPRATYEIQWGEIERPTHRNTSWDYARFEVPAQRWADLSEGGFGVALLNDCKYGHDISDGVLRLTLIKSSSSPDPDADQGLHTFLYSVLPHGGSLEDVRTEARRLNMPLRAVPGRAASPVPFVACDRANVLVETVKPADDGAGTILRLYETARTRTRARLTFAVPPARVTRCDLRERDAEAVELRDGGVSLTVAPYEIVTLRVLPG